VCRISSRLQSNRLHIKSLSCSRPPLPLTTTFNPPKPPTLQDPAALVAANGGRPPMTMQAFTKLVDKAGDPPPPAPDPPAQLPPPDGGAPGAGEGETGVPTLAEVGFTQQPTSPFKVKSAPQPQSLFGSACLHCPGRALVALACASASPCSAAVQARPPALAATDAAPAISDLSASSESAPSPFAFRICNLGD
jgi:hypothetical protein